MQIDYKKYPCLHPRFHTTTTADLDKIRDDLLRKLTEEYINNTATVRPYRTNLVSENTDAEGHQIDGEPFSCANDMRDEHINKLRIQFSSGDIKCAELNVWINNAFINGRVQLLKDQRVIASMVSSRNGLRKIPFYMDHGTTTTMQQSFNLNILYDDLDLPPNGHFCTLPNHTHHRTISQELIITFEEYLVRRQRFYANVTLVFPVCEMSNQVARIGGLSVTYAEFLRKYTSLNNTDLFYIDLIIARSCGTSLGVGDNAARSCGTSLGVGDNAARSCREYKDIEQIVARHLYTEATKKNYDAFLGVLGEIMTRFLEQCGRELSKTPNNFEIMCLGHIIAQIAAKLRIT